MQIYEKVNAFIAVSLRLPSLNLPDGVICIANGNEPLA